jgi:hypothetical protein
MRPQLLQQGDGACGMAQTPVERGDEYGFIAEDETRYIYFSDAFLAFNP